MNEAIIDFFKLVVDGIKEEYEKGASYRKPEQDVETIKQLLADKDKIIKERVEIIYEMSKNSKDVTVPMIRKEIEVLKDNL